MKFGQLDINPAVNPGILDTGTWDTDGAARQIAALKTEPPAGLVSLPDGQQVLAGRGEAIQDALGQPLTTQQGIAYYPTNAAALDKYCRRFAPSKGPRALGPMPRLGIGTRMTTAVWPGIFGAMGRAGFAANSIQNSIRELNLMEDLLHAHPPARNYAFCFGTIESGYTGSSFEGLLVAGTLAALKCEAMLAYGADADHVQVKRGEEGMDRAKTTLNAARYYSFYTMDLSDILDYRAPLETAIGAKDYLTHEIASGAERKAVLALHKEPFGSGSYRCQLDDAQIGRLVGKHWRALGALEELTAHLGKLKDGVPFDLELTIDEYPPEIGAFDCLTSEEEMLFLLRESQRRGLPLTHIAPNFGVEKGHDYRCPDGLDGLDKRIRAQFAVAEEFGVLLDFHSGDDLTSAPRRVIQKATGGRHHFKVSPMLQLLFADVLQRYNPALFQEWWDDAVAYATREAEADSEIAIDCLRQYEASGNKTPSRHHEIFHWYSFAFVGRRDERGQFLHRDRFYTLSPEFYAAYQLAIADYLCGLAAELF